VPTPVIIRSLSRRRPRDKEESSKDNLHPLCNGNGPRKKTATGSAKFVADLEFADKAEVSPRKKRRGATITKAVGKKDAVGKCAQDLEGVHAVEKDAGSEVSELTSRDDGSANKHSQKVSTSKAPSNASLQLQQRRLSPWKARLSELADYRKTHGHCNVPKNDSENVKLASWVATQRKQYKSHLGGRTAYITLSRIQELEDFGFEWGAARDYLLYEDKRVSA
jgi:hypothetical protein